jgi:uncharacterized protein YjbJ (UPF0337 family)
MNKDQVKGHINEASGDLKEATGKIIGNKTLQAKGKQQSNNGKVQEAVGAFKQSIKKVAEIK